MGRVVEGGAPAPAPGLRLPGLALMDVNEARLAVGWCTSWLRIILLVRESSTMPPLHHRVREYCNDSTPLLLSAHRRGTPVAVCHVVSDVAKPQWASRTKARYAQHDPTPTRQGASPVWRLDAQASLCPV